MDMDVTRTVWEMEEISLTGYNICCNNWKAEFGTEFFFKRLEKAMQVAPKGLLSPVTKRQVRPFANCPFCGRGITITVKEPAGPGVEEAAEK